MHSIPNDSREISFSKGRRKQEKENCWAAAAAPLSDGHAREKKTAKKLTPCLQLIFFFLHGAGKWLFMIIRQSWAAHRRRELGREGKNSRCARTHTHTRYSNEARRRISISNARAMYSVSAQPTDGRRRASSLRATVATTCCCATTAIMLMDSLH